MLKPIFTPSPPQALRDPAAERQQQSEFIQAAWLPRWRAARQSRSPRWVLRAHAIGYMQGLLRMSERA
jgi:hypothetical protein